MNIGMLWFDDDPKVNLAEKLKRAIDYYSKKYGKDPKLCYVHPDMIGESSTIEGIEIKPNRSILPNHFWLCIGDPK